MSNLIDFADLSTDTLRDMVVEIREIIHMRTLEMGKAKDLAKRLNRQDHIRRNILIQKYDELTDMIKNVGKDNAGKYVHERRKTAKILWENFGIIKEETKHFANLREAAQNMAQAIDKDIEKSLVEKMYHVKNAEPVDNVNHPSHYTQGKIEVIDFIDDQKLGFYEAQILKYVLRARFKGNELQDLQKAQWYLNRLITIKVQESEK